MNEPRYKIAVFIDFDNIEIGIKTTLNTTFDVAAVLDAIKERGEVVTKIAYGDWTRAGEYSRQLTQQAIRMVQRNVTPGGDKNGADINLALDALEMALTHDHINAYVIVGGDSDFISLVEKLKQYDKTVFVVGGRAFTSVILQKNCHEFLAYENIAGLPPAGRRSHERGRPAGQVPLTEVFPLVKRALQVLADREASPQLGLLKSTLLQLDSTFSERDYGSSSFRDFAERLERAGLVKLNQVGRSVLVELVEKRPESAAEAATVPAPLLQVKPGREVAEPAETPEPSAGLPIEALRTVRAVFERAAPAIRWPLYVRNIKQHLKAADPAFDERRFGFVGILDLLRGCQREGIFHLERDRKGVIRVYAGPALERKPDAQAGAASPIAVSAREEGAGAALPEVPDVLPFEPVAAGGEAAAAGDMSEPPQSKRPRRRRQSTTTSATGEPQSRTGTRKPRSRKKSTS